VPKILLEGRPGAGKTTLARTVADALKARGLSVAGFYTEEIRDGGRRIGFSIEAFSGQRGVLAHVDRPGKPRVGRYGVDVASFERIALAALEHSADIVVIDEIGKMELLSDAFQAAVTEIIGRDLSILATVHAFRHPFTDALKARLDVDVLEVHRSTGSELADEIERLVVSGA
jgi:nucleoside-triphosphatase